MRWEGIKEKIEELGYEVKETKRVNLHQIEIEHKIDENSKIIAKAYKDWELSAHRNDKHIRSFSIYLDDEKRFLDRYEPTSLQEFYDILFEMSKKEKSFKEIINKKEIIRAEKEVVNYSYQAYRSESAYYSKLWSIEELKGNIDAKKCREKINELNIELRIKYKIGKQN